MARLPGYDVTFPNIGNKEIGKRRVKGGEGRGNSLTPTHCLYSLEGTAGYVASFSTCGPGLFPALRLEKI